MKVSAIMNNETEVWKDVKGYEGLYQVSNLGNVKSLYGLCGRKYVKREKILKKKPQRLSLISEVVNIFFIIYLPSLNFL